MFGAYRTMLAIWVMAYHLLKIPTIGGYAVFAFFTLSGFLMTTVMHNSYGYDIRGMKGYLKNRFLRLYPMYWMTILLSAIIILFVGSAFAKAFHTALYLPATPADLVTNITMIFPVLFPYELEPRLSPPTWALTLELFFYFCIALGISKNINRTIIWVISSITYYISSYLLDLGEGHRYGSIFAASLPFSLGALLFFKKEACYRFLKNTHLSNPILIVSLFTLNAFLFALNAQYSPFRYSGTFEEIGKYSNIMLSLLTITALLYRGDEIFNKKIDKFLGDFSYPVYLLHWQCALFAAYVLFSKPVHGLGYDSICNFLAALVLVLALSYMLIATIDKSIEKLRAKNRTAQPMIEQ